jgi:CHAT domain
MEGVFENAADMKSTEVRTNAASVLSRLHAKFPKQMTFLYEHKHTYPIRRIIGAFRAQIRGSNAIISWLDQKKVEDERRRTVNAAVAAADRSASSTHLDSSSGSISDFDDSKDAAVRVDSFGSPPISRRHSRHNSLSGVEFTDDSQGSSGRSTVSLPESASATTRRAWFLVRMRGLSYTHDQAVAALDHCATETWQDTAAYFESIQLFHGMKFPLPAILDALSRYSQINTAANHLLSTCVPEADSPPENVVAAPSDPAASNSTTDCMIAIEQPIPSIADEKESQPSLPQPEKRPSATNGHDGKFAASPLPQMDNLHIPEEAPLKPQQADVAGVTDVTVADADAGADAKVVSAPLAPVSEQPQQPSPTHPSGPHFVFLQAAPFNLSNYGSDTKLDFKKEQRTIVRAFTVSKRAFDAVFTHATSNVLLHQLRSRARVLHISAHGDRDRFALEDHKGGIDWLSRDDLRHVTSRISGTIRLVVLSACHSSEMGKVFEDAKVPHVVCIHEGTKVSDRSACTFTHNFYEGLCQGVSVIDAFELGKSAVFLESRNGSHPSSPTDRCCCLHTHDPACTICPECHRHECCDAHGHIDCHMAKQCCRPVVPHREEAKFMLLGHGDHDEVLFPIAPSGPIPHPLIPSGPWRNVGTSPPRANIPAPPEYFIGREDMQHRVFQRCLYYRLTGVTGAPGVGKSALARVVATYMNERSFFDDGVVYVDVGDIRSIVDVELKLLYALEHEVGLAPAGTYSQAIHGISRSASTHRNRATTSYARKTLEASFYSTYAQDAADGKVSSGHTPSPSMPDLSKEVASLSMSPSATKGQPWDATSVHASSEPELSPSHLSSNSSHGADDAMHTPIQRMHNATPPNLSDDSESGLSRPARAQSAVTQHVVYAHDVAGSICTIIHNVLQDMRVLIVLDNCDAIAESMPRKFLRMVRALLERSPDVNILTTSGRSIGNVSGFNSHAYHLDPLSDLYAARLLLYRARELTQTDFGDQHIFSVEGLAQTDTLVRLSGNPACVEQCACVMSLLSLHEVEQLLQMESSQLDAVLVGKKRDARAELMRLRYLIKNLALWIQGDAYARAASSVLSNHDPQPQHRQHIASPPSKDYAESSAYSPASANQPPIVYELPGDPMPDQQAPLVSMGLHGVASANDIAADVGPPALSIPARPLPNAADVPPPPLFSSKPMPDDCINGGNGDGGDGGDGDDDAPA